MKPLDEFHRHLLEVRVQSLRRQRLGAELHFLFEGKELERAPLWKRALCFWRGCRWINSGRDCARCGPCRCMLFIRLTDHARYARLIEYLTIFPPSY